MLWPNGTAQAPGREARARFPALAFQNSNFDRGGPESKPSSRPCNGHSQDSYVQKQQRGHLCGTWAGKKIKISLAERSRLFLAVEGGSGFRSSSRPQKGTSKNTNAAAYAKHGRARQVKKQPS